MAAAEREQDEPCAPMRDPDGHAATTKSKSHAQAQGADSYGSHDHETSGADDNSAYIQPPDAAGRSTSTDDSTTTTTAAAAATAHPPQDHPLLADSHAGLPVASTTATATTTSVTTPPGLPFVAPSDLLRLYPARSPSIAPSPPAGAAAPSSRPATRDKPMTPLDKEQIEGLRAIRAFLKVRTSYDVLPLSYRLIVFDTSLLVKKSLNILTQCAIVSAPLWDSKTSTFAGLLTTSDYLNVVQYYWQNPDALQQVDQFRLNSLREIERAIGVTPIETVSIHPLEPLYDACRRMLASRARRIPLIDTDDETQREMVVSVITQYRILKFISVNVKETQNLRKPLRELNVGSYTNLATATMETPVMDCIHMLVKKSISSVPILDKDGALLNVFEAVDVITLIKGGEYEANLNLTVGKALEKRPDDFPGIYTCTLNDRLDTIFDTIRKSRVHRLVVTDEAGQLKGLLSLSDILDYTLTSPLGDEHEQ